jgi:hypothetical protein
MKEHVMNPALEQDIIDACTAMEMVRESAKNGDSVMMVTALKDVRKRVNRLLKTTDMNMPAATVDPQLPTSPRLPIKEGEV